MIELEFLKNVFGSLDSEITERIKSYLDSPTYCGWDDIQSIIVSDGIKTIWQWVLDVDPTFPQIGRRYGDQMRITREWERIPDKETIKKAIKLAASENTKINF